MDVKDVPAVIPAKTFEAVFKFFVSALADFAPAPPVLLLAMADVIAPAIPVAEPTPLETAETVIVFLRVFILSTSNPAQFVTMLVAVVVSIVFLEKSSASISVMICFSLVIALLQFSIFSPSFWEFTAEAIDVPVDTVDVAKAPAIKPVRKFPRLWDFFIDSSISS